MKKFLKKLWDKLRGHKRNIGIALLTILQGTDIFFPDAIPQDKNEWFMRVITLLLIGGAGDALSRDEKVKAAIKRGTDKVKNIANGKNVQK